MYEDEPFHTLLIAAALVIFPMMFYHRLKARTDEPLDRAQEGRFILFTLRPIGLATMAGVFTYLVSPASMRWAFAPMPVSARWIAIAAGAIGTLCLFWTVSTLGPNLTDTVVTRRDHTLVTNGPYRFVRHPFYGCVALLLASFGVAAANWALLLGGVIVVALLVLRTAVEEARLVARFGDRYRGYMNTTGRFLPGIGAHSRG